MRIGERVVIEIKNQSTIASLLNGLTGTIVGEKVSDSQLAMLFGVSRWRIKLDTPLSVAGNDTLAFCELKEHDLVSIGA